MLDLETMQSKNFFDFSVKVEGMFQKILNLSLLTEIPGKKKIAFMRKHLLAAQDEIESSTEEKNYLIINPLVRYSCL